MTFEELEQQMVDLKAEQAWLCAESDKWLSASLSPERESKLHELRRRNGQLSRDIDRYLARLAKFKSGLQS